MAWRTRRHGGRGRVALCGGALLAAGIAAGSAAADPGDVYQVTGEEVNLRSDPSDESNIRTTVVRGDELIELRREGAWLGVRTLTSGQEGWIYEGLVTQISTSNLGGGAAGPGAPAAEAAGFQRLSPEFDTLLGRINQDLGYALADEVRQADADTLQVVPTEAWLLNSARETKLMTALALYEMWKRYNNGRPVEVAIVDRNDENLITIGDTGSGPDLTVGSPIAMR